MVRKARKGQELIEQGRDIAATQGRPPLLRVGEVARRSGVGVEALRFYERSGLLDRPARTETATGSTAKKFLNDWLSSSTRRRWASHSTRLGA